MTTSVWVHRSGRATLAAICTAMALVLAACGGAGGASSSSAKASGQPIVIGVVQDLSGGSTYYSQEGVKALKAFAAAANNGEFLYSAATVGSKPGILGRPIELKFQDDQNNPNLTVAKTRELVDAGAQIVFFMSGSSSSLQGRTVCMQSKVMCIATNNVNSKIVDPPNNEYVFTVAPPSAPTADVFVAAWNKLGYKRVAYYSDNSATGKALKDQNKAAFEKAGFTTGADESVEIGARDAVAQVLRIRDSKPDVIFDATQNAAEDSLLHLAAQKLNVTIPRWGTNSVTAQPKIWQLSGDSINGLFVVDNLSPANPNTDQVRKLYRKTYGAAADYLFVQSMVWDSLMLTKKAIETANSTDGTKVRDAMVGVTKFPSAYGQKGYALNYSQTHHNGSSGAGNVIVKFANGKPSIIWDVYQPQ